jgi:hypothetical protein
MSSREWKRTKARVTGACVRGDFEEPAMARVRRQRISNDDLVEVAEGQLHNILMFYKRFEDNRPVMLLDLPSGKIYAYPYEKFKAELGHESQVTLTADYGKAAATNKVVVFVRDNDTHRLVSMLFDYG